MPKIMYKKELELLLNVSIFFGKKSGIRQLPDIRHPAVAGYPAGYPASGIFYEKHPASGKKKQIRPNPNLGGYFESLNN